MSDPQDSNPAPSPEAPRNPAEAAPAPNAPASAEASASPPADGEARRPRRRRRVSTKTATDGEGEKAPRKRRPRRPRKGEPKGEAGAAPVIPTAERAVYTQDVVIPPPPEKPPSAVKEMPDASKITLLLHPAPKASAGKKRKKNKGPATAKQALAAKTARRTKKKGDKRRGAPQAPKVELKAAWKKAGLADAAEALVAAEGSGEELVKIWLDAGNAAAIAAAAASDEVKGKSRKAARRAIGVLKSRGIEVPEIETASPVIDEGPAEPVASFIPPDSTGLTFVSIAQRQKGGLFSVADAVIRPAQGIVQVTSGKIAGHKIRNWKQRVEDEFGTAPVEVPVDWARHLIAEARKQNDASGTVVPLGFDTAAPLFGPAPDEAPPHPVADLDGPDDAAVEKATADSEKLHAAPEFRGWVPDRAAVDEMLAQVGQRLQGEDSQDPEKVNAALDEEVGAACDRFFTPERREAMAARMRDAAISVRDRDGDDAARDVLAVATAIERAGLVTKPPREIPFLALFFRKAVAWMAQQNRGQLRLPA